MICNKAFPSGIYRYHSIRAELHSWSDYGDLFTRLDKYRVFFYTPNCISVSSLFTYRAILIIVFKLDLIGVSDDTRDVEI